MDFIWKLIGKLKRYIQYSLVGFIGAGLHFLILWLLTDKANVWYVLSATIAITVASINNFTLNYLWTFKDRKKQINNIFVGWFKFLLSIGFTEALYLGLLYLFTDKAGLHYILSAFFSLSLTTVIRYLTAEKWIWSKKKKSKISDNLEVAK